MRFYELSGGTIAIDGQDITTMPRGDMRRNIGMVLQDAWLFEGTVAQNIAYGKQDATILVLDEATSSVDTHTEMDIQKAMSRLMEGKTSFVIAHRLTTIQNADLILVVQDGDIVERGNHQELLRQNGFYASLYNSQFEVAG